jgi:hypothetical protein
MGFIEHAVQEATAAERALEETLRKIARGTDFGAENQQPEIDPKQQAEFFGVQQQGRTGEIYRQCLEYHGFVWVPVEKLRMLPGLVTVLEGQWRWPRVNRALLAFTPTDLTTGFPGMAGTSPAEQLDKYLRDYKLQLRLRRERQAPKEAKAALRRFRDRR